MADLDDGPEQIPLDNRLVESAILELLGSGSFDLIITHGPSGEYTRHLRHEETAQAVLALVRQGKLSAKQLWMFAYEDGGRKYLPRPIKTSDIYVELPDKIWQKKYNIITEIYGFEPDSFEAKTTSRAEAFSRG
jgi:LmbE family N-acetylglucosaminyl deacetylase